MWIELEVQHGSTISFRNGSQSGQTLGDCFSSLLSAIVAGIKRRFKSFKLTWLPFSMLEWAIKALNWCETKNGAFSHRQTQGRHGAMPNHFGPVIRC